MHSHNFDWNLVVNILIDMYETPQKLLIASQLSYIPDEEVSKKSQIQNPHVAHCYKNTYQITSLYHHQFFKLLPVDPQQLQLFLSELDTDSPQIYNLGRSQGQQIAFSKNHQFILKTISASNFYHFKRVFHNDYFKIVDDNKQSYNLIAKVYGIFYLEQLDTEQFQEESKKTNQKTYFILMENLFYHIFQMQLLMVFDLKGATFNRSSKDFQKDFEDQQKGNKPKIIKGKDNDFVKLNDQNPLRLLKKEILDELLNQIEFETELFQKSNIMDYSLMIILARGNIKQRKEWRLIHLDDDLVVSFGIIDYLQEYNSQKLVETKIKNFMGMFKQKNQISCIDSEAYRTRFRNFFQQFLK